MPFPVKPGEKKESFVSRCIEHHVGKGYKQPEASAMCYSMWENKDKKKLSIPPKALDWEQVPISLQEVNQESEWQVILPKGQYQTHRYGKLHLSQDFLQKIVDNWRSKVMGERQPFVDKEHDFGEAQGWITDMRVQDEGLGVKIDWTEPGKQKVNGRLYRYFSASIGDAINQQTGDSVYPVLIGCALTNTPAMYMLKPAHLSENAPGGDESSHGEGDDSEGRENNMNFEDVLKAIVALTDDQKAKIAEALGIKPVDESVEAETTTELSEVRAEVAGLRDANKQLSAKLKEIADAQKLTDRNSVIDLALKEGRMLPKDREVWEKRFDANPTAIKEVIQTLPKVVDFTERGTGDGGEQGGEQVTLTDEKRRILREQFKLSDEDIDVRILGKAPTKK